MENLYDFLDKLYIKYPIKFIGAVSFLCLFSILTLSFKMNVMGKLPTVEELREFNSPNPSKMYDTNGVYLSSMTRSHKQYVPYEDFSPHIINALIATEDVRFYEHSGIDYRSLLRVAIKSVLLNKGNNGGGSTITQQIAKNLYPREHFPAFSIVFNKIKEWQIAVRLEKTYSKTQLLNLYLNEIPFTDGCIGAPMAAKKFFNKSVKDLDIKESALIVGMLAGNTRYNPRLNPDKAILRRNAVLYKMFKNNVLDRTSYEKLSIAPIELHYTNVAEDNAKYKFFRAVVLNKTKDILKGVKKPNGEYYNIFTDNLKIYTTLDKNLQDNAEEAIKINMSQLQQKFDTHWNGGKWWTDDLVVLNALYKTEYYQYLKDKYNANTALTVCNTRIEPRKLYQWNGTQRISSMVYCTVLDSIKFYYRQLNTGFVAMNAKNGNILTWVGGIDYNHSSYDNANSSHQVGSTFKPIVYLTALEEGIKPCDYISNEQVAYTSEGIKKLSELTPKDKAKTSTSTWIPRNSDNDYSGAFSLEGALAHSVNVVSGSLIYKIRPNTVRGMATKLGLEDIPDNYSIALGVTSHSIMEMIKAYNIINTGLKIEPVFITHILDQNNNMIADFRSINRSKSKKVNIADTNRKLITKMLNSVVTVGTGAALHNKSFSGKTGTTQNNADGWFIAYNPDIVIGSWVGGITPMVHFRDLSNGQASRTVLPQVNLFIDKLKPNYLSKFEPLSLTEQLCLNCPMKIYRQDEIYRDSIKQDTLLEQWKK